MQENTETDRKNGAFTLLEVLLSGVILAGLMVLLLTMANRTFTLWGDGQRRIEQQREARASLRMIAEDLRSAVITGDSSSLLIRPEKGGDSLFFLVSHPGEQRQPGIKGDLCAAGYFTAPDPAGNGEWNLYRFHASGDEVAEAVREQSLDALYATAAPGKANTELLARNIAALRIMPVLLDHQDSAPAALRVTVTALNRSDLRRIKEVGDERKAVENLLNERGTCLSSLVTLPTPEKHARIP